MYDIILCNRNHSIRSDVSGDAIARSDSESSRHTLYIIGNGFDLANGVRSSYRDFAKFLKKQGRDGHYLYDTMEFYLGSAPDLWGDFEASLAYLDRGKAMDSVDIIQGDLLDVKDPEDENFSAAEYFATIEMGLANLTNIQEMLLELFFKWVKTLDSDKPVWKCPVKLDYDGRYINFNYTEFLETRYGSLIVTYCTYMETGIKGRRTSFSGMGTTLTKHISDGRNQLRTTQIINHILKKMAKRLETPIFQLKCMGTSMSKTMNGKILHVFIQ